MLINIDWPKNFYYFFAVIDVIAVAYIFYKIIVYIFNTKTKNIIKGVVPIAIVFFVANIFKLKTILWLFEKGFTILPIAIFIIFQPEIRRILINLGTKKLFSKFNEQTYLDVLEKIYSAMKLLSERKVGALILLQQDVGLNSIQEKSTPLEAEVTEQLLVSIFIPTSPLHDGAVIVKDDKILVARAFFPITEERIAPHLGSRHRAAIGITEHTDSVALVVSEETGYISLAYEGKIYYNIGLDRLREKVLEILGIEL